MIDRSRVTISPPSVPGHEYIVSTYPSNTNPIQEALECFSRHALNALEVACCGSPVGGMQWGFLDVCVAAMIGVTRS